MTRRITAAALDRSGDHSRPYQDNPPLRLVEIDLDPSQPGELLIRIDAAGLCHSDLSVVNGDRPRPMPMAIGHEATGIVEELGSPHDTRFSIGDRVVLAFLPSCGECVRCQSGEGYMCPTAPPRTARANCSAAASGCTNKAARSTIILASRPSPAAPWSTAARR